MFQKPNILGKLFLMVGIFLTLGNTQPNVGTPSKKKVLIDSDEFEKQVETARFLATSELLISRATVVVKGEFAARLQGNRAIKFAFVDQEGKWHVVLGKYDQIGFEPFNHLIYNADHQLMDRDAPFDLELIARYADALIKAQKYSESKLDFTGVIMDTYLKSGENQIMAYSFPAVQQDSMVYYGAEIVHEFDQNGILITEHNGKKKKKKANQDAVLWGVPLNKYIGQNLELWMNYQKNEEPPLSSIYFAWRYKDVFDEIYIETKNSVTSLREVEIGQYEWLHYYKTKKRKETCYSFNVN